MNNKIKIIIIVILLLLAFAVFLVLVRPALQQNTDITNQIEEQKETNNQLEAALEGLVEARDDFHMFYAQYQKYAVELPSQSNIQVLANEIYNISQFAETKLQTINFDETSAEEDSIGVIEINMVVTGPYHHILVFLRAFESMPRITRVESIELNYAADGYPEMTAVLIGKTFYQMAE